MKLPIAVLTGYFGSTLPTSAANMLVLYGGVPHSGPSKNPPVTGTPCWLGYLAARKNSGLVETMPKAPLEMASCTAVAISVGLVWSSRTMPESLWPLTPPSAFCRAMRALNPAGAEVNSDDPGPVSEVIMARVIGAPDVAAPAVAPSAPTTSMTPTRRNDANANRAMRRETPAIVAPLGFGCVTLC